MIRTRFYLKSFDERQEYAISSACHIHFFDGNPNFKVITLEGMEVCIPGWYIIHVILKSTYHTYALMYKEGFFFGGSWKQGSEATSSWNRAGHWNYEVYH